jgi:hypothetical protein
MDSMYGVTSPLKLRSTWMLTLENKVIATCIVKTLVATCNKFFLIFFFKVQGPNPDIGLWFCLVCF